MMSAPVQDKLFDQFVQDMGRPSYESLYHQLGRLRAEMPHPTKLGQPESTRWMGRALALVDAVPGCTIELATLRTAVMSAGAHLYATSIATVIDTVMAKVELKLPAQSQGAYIPAGGVFDGFQAIAKAVSTAQHHVLLIDPYADEVLIRDFAPLMPERVHILVLSDAGMAKPSLKPAAERWIAQYPSRPLQARITPAKTLHDRDIIIDESAAWALGQSFKDLAKRAHSSLVRMDPETAGLKIAAYKELWARATPLV